MKKYITIIIIFIFASFTKNLAQNPPISPRWVFEPWVWEDENNTETAANNMIVEYKDNNIPVGAIIIDSPWEAQYLGSNYDEETNNGYNTFTFNENWYNGPQDFIHNLNTQDIHVVLWITGLIDKKCSLYNEIPANYFVNDGATFSWWKGSTNACLIDFFNQDAVKYWENLMDRILDNYEVDGWKVDESDNQLPDGTLVHTPEGDKTKQEYSEAYYREMYTYIHNKRLSKGNLGMIMARPYCDQSGPYSYTPRYFAPKDVNSAGWVGDQEHRWSGCGLNRAIETIFISANAGYAALGSDIGGGGYTPYNDTYQDKNLFIRWAQFGSLLPIMENGGRWDRQHQPWRFDDNNVINIYRYFAYLHHELVPYIYSYDIEAHATGTSIVRPVGADIDEWASNQWEYTLGDNILVSTIYDENNQNLKTINFPAGYYWIDYWNDNNVYQGGTAATLNYTQYQYPVFIREGAIIPLNVDNSVTGHGTENSENYLTFLIYPKGSSSLKYYTDESNSTELQCNERCGGYTISFSKNTGSVIIRLKNNIEPRSIALNGGLNILQKNSYSELENSPSGWFFGKINQNENTYTWIKITDPATNIYVNTATVSDINPQNYELSKLNLGNQYYIDRDFTLTDIPEEFQGLYMIKTGNNDKKVIGLNFNFYMCSSADVYIAYDYRLSVPSWLSAEYEIVPGKTISVSDRYGGYLNIWKSKQTIQAGQIHLGDNEGNDNSSMYFVFFNTYESISVYAKVFLQGPYAGSGTMNTTLQSSSLIPLAQPYNVAPWSYGGTESVSSVPSGVVDWVLVELRTGTASSTIVKTRAGFLMSDGNIYDIDGTNHINFSGISGGNYYIVIKHRNHLAVMSAGTVTLPNSTAYDFTTSETQAYTTGPTPMADLGGTKYGMYAGDSNSSGIVNSADKSSVNSNMLSSGYFNSDTNMSGIVNSADKSNINTNMLTATTVP